MLGKRTYPHSPFFLSCCVFCCVFVLCVCVGPVARAGARADVRTSSPPPVAAPRAQLSVEVEGDDPRWVTLLQGIHARAGGPMVACCFKTRDPSTCVVSPSTVRPALCRSTPSTHSSHAHRHYQLAQSPPHLYLLGASLFASCW